MSLFQLPIEILAKEWVKSFEKAPILTALVSLVISVIATTGGYYIDKDTREKQEAQRLQNLNYQTQIQQLNQTENNIKQLLQFVETQKMTLRNTEDTISSLKSEQEKLKPLVESDRSVVDAIFRAQEERNSTSIWRERWIGFGLGVVASLFASFLWFVINLLIKHRYNKAINMDGH
jgi:Na+-transporting NADH:ubiquinone oxidoreductase subunit NqrC